MRRFIFLAVALLAVAAAAWVFWPRDSNESLDEPVVAQMFTAVSVESPAGQQGLTLTGTVRDANGAPVPNAHVHLASSSQSDFIALKCGFDGLPLIACRSPETARTVATLFEGHRGELTPALNVESDAQGAFRFEHLAGTSFTVWAEANGFGMGLKDRAAPGESVALILPAPRRLAGRLIDERGAGVAGVVRVSSMRLASITETKTEPTGAFAIDGLGEGPFVVSAVAEGKLPSLATRVDGTAVSIEMRTPRALEVHVLDGKTPVDATVVLEGDHFSRTIEVKKGLALIEGLTGRPLVATARAGTLASAPQAVRFGNSLRASITLKLVPAGSLAVSVIDEQGQPVPAPTIELFTVSSKRISTRVAQTGELTVLGPIAAGAYELRVSAAGFTSTKDPVVVKAGESPLEVTLEHAVTIAGTVVDEYGRPAPGVTVLVTPTGDTPRADAEGHFSVSVPSPGLYVLHAHHSDWGGGEVKVTAPDAKVILPLEPGAGASVQVTADGRAIEGASVVMVHSKGNFQSDRGSGADGVVLMRGLPPDSYSVLASHPDYVASVPQKITVVDGEMLAVKTELRIGGTVKGVVVDTSGQPVAGVQVTMRRMPPTTSDQEGHFELRPLAMKGDVDLEVRSNTHRATERIRATVDGPEVRITVKAKPTFHGRLTDDDGAPITTFRVDQQDFTSSDGEFEVAEEVGPTDLVALTFEAQGFASQTIERPGNNPDLGTFTLHRADPISGVVKDGSGAPVADAIVSCTVCDQKTRTDAQGTFTLGKPFNMADFTISAKKGHRSVTRRVAASKLTGLELILESTVRVSGTAYAANGELAAGVEVAVFPADDDTPASAVTGSDGRYQVELASGAYRFMLGRGGDPAVLVQISGTEQTVDLGARPGLGTIAVRLVPKPGYALWLVRGDVVNPGNPPMDLVRSPYAQLVYQPRSQRVVFNGLEPGRYTLVWTSFHAAVPNGPTIVPVDVPAQTEVSLP